ncbi:hypothetical protein NKG95_23640, partial [Mesorhizobium sp. M1423]|uniref:hypothetical protein n=1 Tax=Mesorhizobium sp. M1423 TaxID=2957101 RepID=UPI00333C7B18
MRFLHHAVLAPKSASAYEDGRRTNVAVEITNIDVCVNVNSAMGQIFSRAPRRQTAKDGNDEEPRGGNPAVLIREKNGRFFLLGFLPMTQATPNG